MKITQLVTGPLSVNTLFVPLESGGLMVVDPGGDINHIITHLSTVDLKVVLILLTHGHFDHIIALPALAKTYPDADIAIHGGDARFVGLGALERHYAFFASLGAESLIRKFRDELPEATIFLEDNCQITLKDGTVLLEWEVMHTPGHSPGSVCLYNEAEKTLISGDTLFNSGFGRTDSDGGSFTELKKSIERLFALPPETIVLPGHGAQTTIGRERF